MPGKRKQQFPIVTKRGPAEALTHWKRMQLLLFSNILLAFFFLFNKLLSSHLFLNCPFSLSEVAPGFGLNLVFTQMIANALCKTNI